MILGSRALIRLQEHDPPLVENLEPRRIEGSGFDLRIGKLFSLSATPLSLGVATRGTPDVTEDTSDRFVLRPGVYHLMQTMERLNLPLDLSALFTPRSTLYRSGILLLTGNAAPGYRGELTFGIINLRALAAVIERGARVAFAQFYEVTDHSLDAVYRGQWQGGRVSTQGKSEVQV